ncbi:hypothetical protein [Paenibacillus sp. FSL P4-0288]|uniref:hypothetical protein n=1 Tax=Paenibacillus sp. FSL P4-0288 TaxID=2921633 RepID=UPI0030F57D70
MEFGYEERRFVLGVKAVANGGELSSDDAKDTDEYIAPDGFIITGIGVHEINKQGHGTELNKLLRNINDDTLNFEEFDQTLKELTGQFYFGLTDKGNSNIFRISKIFHLLKERLPWARGMWAEVTAHAEPNAYGIRDYDYYAQNLFYVGIKQDRNSLLSKWIAGTEANFHYSWAGVLVPPESKFIYTNTDHHDIKNRKLIVSSHNNAEGSVALEIGNFPSGSEVSFKTSITVENPKNCQLVIREIPSMNRNSPISILVSGTQTLEVNYVTKSNMDRIITEIHYLDNTQQNTTIDLKSTNVNVKKNF